MGQRYEVVVVIPVGPGTKPEFVIDTIRSFIHYTSSSYQIVLSDDSQQGLGNLVKESLPDIDVLPTKKSLGSMAGLYINLANAFHYVLNTYSFELLLKLDTDALVIGPEPEEEAFNLFREYPLTGIAGQYPLDYHGQPWDREFPRARIANGTSTWKFIKRPIANLVLRKLYLKALQNGYHTGESVFGGAYFMSNSFLKRLAENKLLPNPVFQTLNLGEDHLFALLAKAEGFELGNLSSGTLPFACAWKGLPASPEELFQKGKKIIHSTRSWKDYDEEHIRLWFREKRTKTKTTPVPF